MQGDLRSKRVRGMKTGYGGESGGGGRRWRKRRVGESGGG
jgi:hypothetical protein